MYLSLAIVPIEVNGHLHKEEDKRECHVGHSL